MTFFTALLYFILCLILLIAFASVCLVVLIAAIGMASDAVAYNSTIARHRAQTEIDQSQTIERYTNHRN